MNYCDCGQPEIVFAHQRGWCWECWDKAQHTVQIKPTGSIHVDFESTVAGCRVRLCTSVAWGPDGADPINHPLPTIAAALLAQHPTKDKEFCERCLHLLRMYWSEEIAKAKAYAATLK